MLNIKFSNLSWLLLLIISFNTFAKVDSKLFFQQPDMLLAKISPSGDKIAALRFINDVQNIVLIDSKTKQQTVWLNLAELTKFDSKISNIAWIDNTHLAAQFVEIKKGVADLLDTKPIQQLLILQIPKAGKVNTFSVRTKGTLIHTLPNRTNEFLYAKSGFLSKVYTLNIDKLALYGKKLSKLDRVDGGQFKKSNEVANLKGFVTKWFLDQSGKIKAAFNLNREGEWNLSQFANNGETKVIQTWHFEEDGDSLNSEQLLPIAYAGENNTYYCLDFDAEQQRIIYKVNFATDEKSIIYQAESYKIVDVNLAKDDTLKAIKVINDGKIETIFIGNNNYNEKINLGGEMALIAKISTSVDNHVSIYYGEDHDQPGQFFMVQEQSKKTEKIGAIYPDLSNKLTSMQAGGTVEVEGLSIPYILTMPALEQDKFPLIIMPHGGPIDVFDNHDFNPVTQLLVANGYAVLQVNFRGSSGYSTELRDAGKKQFGGLMLQDIYQAAELVMAQTNIDENNVCTFGMSYGGYAAMMLPLKHPAKYKCAASFAGVSDINLILNRTSASIKQIQWMKENIGDTVNEYEQLKAISPVYLASKFQVPTLVGHGAKDEVVDIEHAYRMKLMLEKYDKSFEWYFDAEGTHSFGSSEQTVKFFDILLEFLNKHLKH